MDATDLDRGRTDRGRESSAAARRRREALGTVGTVEWRKLQMRDALKFMEGLT